MHHKLTKHGRFCKVNNQLPTKIHVELKDISNTFQKLYQFERITWWCLFVLESIVESILNYVLLEKLLKNHGLPEFASDPPLGGELNVNSGTPMKPYP
jgi:hypothetical protein